MIQLDSLKQSIKTALKKKWVKRLDRYIIAKFLGTYFFAIALIISISVVFDVNENIDHFIHYIRLLSEFHTLLYKPVQSAVCIYRRHLLYLEVGGELGDNRHVLYRHEL